ncbi:hypothetical protein LWF15_00155 [Kineosporia rhizophila]|nr:MULTISPECIES: hypothetical protein [Kineosporia]MCE0533916.1 hypothetical protein [Kineosporia rhizophila]
MSLFGLAHFKSHPGRGTTELALKEEQASGQANATTDLRNQVLGKIQALNVDPVLRTPPTHPPHKLIRRPPVVP